MPTWGQVKNEAQKMEQLFQLKSELRDAERDYGEAISLELKEQARLKMDHLNKEIQKAR